MRNATFGAAGIGQSGGKKTARRALGVACATHALHDGYTDLIYILLPVWQAEFGLDYAVLATLRGVYAGMALGYVLAGLSGGLIALFAALALSGVGSSTQHPLASAAVARAYGEGARGPLGTYNFAGDIGKASLPAATSLLLVVLPWRGALGILAAFGLVVAAGIGLLMPRQDGARSAAAPKPVIGAGKGGFALLFAIGVLDSAVRMGLLTFLPFLLKAKGSSLPLVGLALSLVFIGGAFGKFACAHLGARLGVLWTVVATESATAILIAAVIILPLLPVLGLLPLLGVMLNGTSSVLYGTVPELASARHVERSFALFYTGTIGSGAVAPVLFGVLGDAVGAPWAAGATAITALATLPLAGALAPRLERR